MFRQRKNWAQAESTGLKLTLKSLFWWGGGGLNLWKETSTKIYNVFFLYFLVHYNPICVSYQAYQDILCKHTSLTRRIIFHFHICYVHHSIFSLCFVLICSYVFAFRFFLLYLLLILFLVVSIIIFIFCFVCVICVMIHIFKGAVQFHTLFNIVY